MQSNSRKLLMTIAALSTMTTASSALAGMITLGAFQDATLLGGTDATSNQSLADPGLFVGTDGQDNPKRSLIEFNIAGSQIPAGATITGVTLTLTVGQVAGSGGGSSGGGSAAETISLFDEPVAWGQPTNVVGAASFGGTGHGGTPKTGDATWNFAFFNATPWAIPGGDWSSKLTDVADASVTGTLAAFSWSSTQMVADVQNWLDNPSTNDGWIIKNADETDPTDFRAFWSAQGAAANNNAAIAPQLVVTFSVPEPGSIMLLGLGLPALLARRRTRKVTV